MRALDNWVLRALIRDVMHTLIVCQEDLSYFQDGDEDEDENDESCILSLFSKKIYHTFRMVMRMRMMNHAYSHCFPR